MRARLLIIVGVVVVLVVVGGAAVWLVLRLNNGPVSQKILVPVLKPDPFKPNQAFAEPPVVSSRGGLLQATIVAKTGTVSVGGLRVGNTETYAATGASKTARGILGPTLRVQPGDRVDLTLDNRLTGPRNLKPSVLETLGCSASHGSKPQAPGAVASATVHATHIDGGDQFTNLHFHGLHVTPRMRRERGIHVFGDNVLLNLPPGESRFSFRIPKYHPQGTYWYHSHRHECTDDQVYRGLAGLMLIGDARKALPARFHKVRTRSLALKDIQVVKDGDRWAIPGLHDWANPTHRTVNGLVDPTMKMRPDETQLWRVLNASAGVWYVLALVDPANNDARDTFQVVATDGHRRESPATETQVLIPPGQRFDLLVRAPATGQRVLKTLQFNQGRRTMPEDVLATLDVAGPRALLLDPATPVGTPVAFPKKRGPDRQFVFTIGISTKILPAFRINGKVFDANRVDAAPTLDTYERWTLVNKSTEWHPFHIHQNDFRVVSINGNPPPAIEQDQRDIVALPPIRGRKPGVVVIDVPFTDFSGRFVFHCHILDHEDRGMMALVDVRKPRS